MVGSFGVGAGRSGGAVVNRVIVGGAMALALAIIGPGRAPAGTWDALLSNSHWYVPEENLLAYMSVSGSSFTTPPPLVLWDQTLWALGPAVNGLFSGSSQATFYVTSGSSFSQNTSIQGIATEAGQIRMKFTPTSGGNPSIGIGQFRAASGTTAMQMQMISGPSGGPYITHWAYMMPYDPGTFTPPSPLPNEDLTSTEWGWTVGSRWNFRSDSLFGLGGEGQFTITNYRNGYFWGSGTGPAGSPRETFTQLGSITPEGNVLFNILDASGSLVSLAGLVVGGPETGRMELRTYDFSGDEPSFGPLGVAMVVPEPGALGLAAVAALALGLRFSRRHAFRRAAFGADGFCSMASSAACGTLLPRQPAGSGAGARQQRTNGHHSMKDPTIRGVVHLIEETKTFGQKGFRKRLVVLEQSKGTFTNFIPVEFVKDGCDAVDDLTVGDEIEVTYRLSGRRWQKDEASEAKYFLSAEGLSFKRLSGSRQAHDGPDDAIAANDAFAEARDDDVPF